MAKRKIAAPGSDCKKGDRIRFATPEQEGEATVASSAGDCDCWPVEIHKITLTKVKRGSGKSIGVRSPDTRGLLCRDEVLEILKG